MDQSCGTGIIPMFLAGFARRAVEPAGRRLVLACSGGSAALAGAADAVAQGLAGETAGIRILDLTPNQDINPALAGCHGLFMGIGPEGIQRAFSFIRNYQGRLSGLPLALFFLFPPGTKPAGEKRLLDALSHLSPLDIRYFDRSGPGLAPAIADWSRNKVLPLMETGWLADLVFPGTHARPCAEGQGGLPF